MQLAEVFKPELIFLDFEANNKEDALDKMVKAVAKSGAVEDAEGLKTALLEREKLGTTGVGSGIAIPHARCNAVSGVMAAFFLSKKGIDFNAIDNKPVNLIFLLLANVAAGGVYLKLLAKISRLLRSDDFRTSLLSVKDPKEVLDIIKENE